MSRSTRSEVDRLYALPLERFTAERDALARELRGSDREAADEVRRLRKPTVSAWAINNLAGRQRQSVNALLEAGQRLRAAQEDALTGGGGAELRQATAREREIVKHLVDRAEEILGERAGPAVLARVRATLHAAASDDEVRAAIEGGRLTRDHSPAGLGPLAQVGERERERTRHARRDKARTAARAELQAARKGDRRAQRSVAAARRELTKRRVEAERVERTLATAQRELDEAEEAAREAARRLVKAERASEER